GPAAGPWEASGAWHGHGSPPALVSPATCTARPRGARGGGGEVDLERGDREGAVGPDGPAEGVLADGGRLPPSTRATEATRPARRGDRGRAAREARRAARSQPLHAQPNGCRFSSCSGSTTTGRTPGSMRSRIARGGTSCGGC